MAEENKTALAKKVYDGLCATLDRREWHYNKHDEDLTVTFGVNGEDIPMDFILKVDAERQLLRMFSILPFKAPEDKRMDMAIATCFASNGLADGSFDYDIAEGKISFRMTASFMGSTIGEGLFDYMINCSCSTVDAFNDKFLMLAKGLISITDFISKG